MREVAGGENVRHRRACDARDAARFCEVRFEESAVPACELAEGMQRLHDARALRPAARGAGGEADDGGFAIAERGESARGGIAGRGAVGEIARRGVLDHGGGGKTVLREADAAGFQVAADLLVRLAVEAVFHEQLVEVFSGAAILVARGESANGKVAAPRRADSGSVRHAVAKLSSSGATRGGSDFGSCRSSLGARSR